MILITEHVTKDPEGQIILDAIATRFGYTGFDSEEVAQTKQEFYQAWILSTTLKEISIHLTITAGKEAEVVKQAEVDTDIKPELEKK